ncbi:extracellular matrix protein 1 [Pelodytes ibericus]
MQSFGMWTLTVQLSLLLCLVHAGRHRPSADEHDMYQREIGPEFPFQQIRVDHDLPVGDEWDLIQREIVPEHPFIEQREVEYRPDFQGAAVPPLPILIQGEPLMSPRGRRPDTSCSGTRPSRVASSSILEDFPPGRPNRSNIGNICSKGRPKTTYGSHNLPQTGFSHLSRQGDAINNLEDGYVACCRRPDKLSCAEEVWKNSLEQFCDNEFSVKTRHYHCCKKQGSERDTCFSCEAPNPSYDFPSAPAPMQEIGSADAPVLGRSRSFKRCPPSSPKCQKESGHKMSELSFPPGEPKSSNVQNICKLRKFRPVYKHDALPQSGFGHYVRQAKALNRMESEFKKCCKDENIACAHTAWEKVLAQFCSQELSTKTRPYECCKIRDRTGMYSCFADNAPYPEYDREVERVSLTNMTGDSLQKLCGDSKLLTKQKQIPVLVSGLRESCCSLPEDEMLQCAEEQKVKFMNVLCNSKKDLWKDSQSCCNKDSVEKAGCFNLYLQTVSVAVSQRKKQH